MADRKRVLIVDDMEQNRKSIKAFLFFLQYDATLAEDGLEAKKILGTEKFDLIVSDIKMPNMNVFELLTDVKRTPSLSGVPVIMLSTLDSSEVMERCKKLGAGSYIVKPFTKEKFEKALLSIAS